MAVVTAAPPRADRLAAVTELPKVTAPADVKEIAPNLTPEPTVPLKTTLPAPPARVRLPVLIPSASTASSNVKRPPVVVMVVVPPVVASLTAESNVNALEAAAKVKLLFNTVWPEAAVRNSTLRLLSFVTREFSR